MTEQIEKKSRDSVLERLERHKKELLENDSEKTNKDKLIKHDLEL